MCSESHFNPDFPSCSPYIHDLCWCHRVPQRPLDDREPPSCLRGKSCHLSKPLIDDSQLFGGYYFCASHAGAEHSVSYSFSSFASGGGFSNVASRPAYQANFVANYFKTQEGKSARLPSPHTPC